MVMAYYPPSVFLLPFFSMAAQALLGFTALLFIFIKNGCQNGLKEGF